MLLLAAWSYLSLPQCLCFYLPLTSGERLSKEQDKRIPLGRPHRYALPQKGSLATLPFVSLSTTTIQGSCSTIGRQEYISLASLELG